MDKAKEVGASTTLELYEKAAALELGNPFRVEDGSVRVHQRIKRFFIDISGCPAIHEVEPCSFGVVPAQKALARPVAPQREAGRSGQSVVMVCAHFRGLLGQAPAQRQRHQPLGPVGSRKCTRVIDRTRKQNKLAVKFSSHAAHRRTETNALAVFHSLLSLCPLLSL